jgi:ABC-type multidrug transport system fused ATPase/permease subunit
MALATKPSLPVQRRVWKAPITKAWWIWLAVSLLLYVIVFAVYLIAIKTQPFPGPFNDPLRSFGILSLLLVLTSATYSLRRRFVRGLPGMARDWLWMHTWIGITAVLIALLHENFAHILRNYCQNASCFTQSYWGTSALLALILLVLSGIFGRLLDYWQAHVIAQDASMNGVGIARSLEERILELEYTVERLSAGKSEQFKTFCLQALEGEGNLPSTMPALGPGEQVEFQHAYETLMARASLAQSLQKQKRARLIISSWRSVHIVLACLALLIILFHGVMELLTNVLHIIRPI